MKKNFFIFLLFSILGCSNSFIENLKVSTSRADTIVKNVPCRIGTKYLRISPEDLPSTYALNLPFQRVNVVDGNDTIEAVIEGGRFYHHTISVCRNCAYGGIQYAFFIPIKRD